MAGAKTIVVTGALGGIGSAIAQSLSAAGHTVIGVDEADGDLSSVSGAQSLASKILKQSPKIDWVVCAHGFVDTEAIFEQQSPEAVEKTFAVNTLSLFYLTQLFVPHLQHGGGFIYISSTSGIIPSGRLAAYSASKAAVNALAEAFALNKPEHTFISICPGPTNTPMRQRTSGDAGGAQSPDVIADTVRTIIDANSNYKSGSILVVKDGITSIHE